MNKPDWKDAPEWAQWLAQDSDGEWFWFEEEPTLVKDRGGSGEGAFMHSSDTFPVRLRSELVGRGHYNPYWWNTLTQRPQRPQLTPRSLGCFEEVAKVIGEDAAEVELQRVIDCDLVGEDWRECSTAATFVWSKTPQGDDFWSSIKRGEYPENCQQPSKETSSEYWDGETWPVPAGHRCIIKSCPSGTPCEAVVDYMNEDHCIWHRTDNGTTIHDRVKYMEFSPVKSETEKYREKVFSQLEEFTGNDCSALMRTDVVEFVLKYYVEEK